MALSVPILRGAVEVSEVLVLGGGLAGASSALRLARAGIPVQVLEREAGPHHKVCGEFLSVEAQADLRAAGFDPLLLGAIPVDRVRVVSRGKTVEAPLPFTALGVSRRSLDEALLHAAERAGATVRRGVKVLEVHRGAVSTSLGPLTAQTILLASGKHDVRGARRRLISKVEGQDYVGFKMHWRMTPRQAAEIGTAVELVLFDGGYIGLQRIAERVLNLCVMVRRDRLARGGGAWEDLLATMMRQDHVARRLDEAEALFNRPLSITRLPYGHVHQSSVDDDPGLFRLGDQAALTAPLTGDGMAIALRSATLASACIEAGADPQDYAHRLRAEVAPQVSRAMLLHRATQMPSLMHAAFAVLGLWPGLLSKVAKDTRLAVRTP
jgi:flavin-dependent dehydrogenase